MCYYVWKCLWFMVEHRDNSGIVEWGEEAIAEFVKRECF